MTNGSLRLIHACRALSLAVLFIASVAATAAAAELAEGARPEVRIGSGVLTASLPAGGSSGFALRLVVIGPRDRILIDESRASGSLSWTLPADATEGYYRFEARIVPRLGSGGSAVATDETPTPGTARRAGTFLLRDGRMIDLDAARELAAERSSTEPEISSAGTSDRAAGVESMTNFTISDPQPTLSFEDTDPDACEGVDWRVLASGAVPGVPNFNFMEVRARDENTCGSFRLMDWEYDSSRSANSQFNAFRVHGSSDISLADGTFFFDKSGAALGMGTTALQATIHMANDFPQIRFDETNDSLAQFSIQADSVPNNEDSRELFFQDEITGAILMTLEQSGELGIGSEEPAARLHVVDATPGPGSHAIIAEEGDLLLRRDGSTAVSFRFSNGSRTWNFFNNAGGVFQLRDATGGTSPFVLKPGARNNLITLQGGNIGVNNPTPDFPIHHESGARLTVGGVWTNASSRSLKTAFEAIDPLAVLAKLAALPVQSWRYKVEEAGTRHLGPVAEDFQRLFGLGDGKSIGTVDADGVMMAAIQGLKQLIEEKDTEIAKLSARLETLEHRTN